MTVPPGVEARPQPHAWLVLMVGGPDVGRCTGLSGLAADLRYRTLGGWRAAVLGLTVVVVGAVGLGAAWWAWDGGSALRRTSGDSLPPFVRVAMTSDTPVRTLAIARTSGEVRWALLEGDLPRLGDDERGLPGTIEPQRGLATSVVNRLLSGSADDQLSIDLARLGGRLRVVAGQRPRPAHRHRQRARPGGRHRRRRRRHLAGAGRRDRCDRRRRGHVDRRWSGATCRFAHPSTGARPALGRAVASHRRRTATGPTPALPDGRQAFTLGAESGVLRLQLTGARRPGPGCSSAPCWC
ncbi:MAG: hypothetical protein R2742_02635 [Micropruina glycogenica]